MKAIFTITLLIFQSLCFYVVAQPNISITNPGLNEPVAITLDVGDPDLYMVSPGSNQPIALLVKNNGDETLKGKLQVVVQSFSGRHFTVDENLVLSTGEQKSVEIPRDKIQELGIQWVDATLKHQQKGVPDIHKEMAFAYMEAVGNENAQDQEMLLGIAYGGGEENFSETCAKAVSRVGIGLHRSPMWWDVPEPDFDYHFRGVRAHRKYKVQPYMFVTRTAPFAQLPVDGKKQVSSPPVPSAWRTWIRQLAEAIKTELPNGQKLYWEIWNEPDIGFFKGTTNQYLEMLKIAHEEIKRADAENNIVMTGGFASVMHGHRKKNMIERVVTEAQDDWEVFAYHEHGTFSKFLGGIEEHLNPILEKAGKPVPVFYTETGMDNRFGERFQASELVKKMAYAWANGSPAYTWFNLHDMRMTTNPRQPGFTYGLYTRLDNSKLPLDFSYSFPKASYVALNTFSTVLNNMKYQKRLKLEENQYGYCFQNEEKQLILSWDQSDASTLLLLNTDAKKAEQVDMMGNSKPLEIQNRQVVLEVGPSPSFVVLHGAGTPFKIESVLARTVSSPAGKTRVVFKSPFSEVITLRYEWKPGLQFTFAEGETGWGKMALQPGEEKSISANTQLKGGGEISLGSVQTNHLSYSIASKNINGEMNVPTKVNAVSVPAEYTDWASFALENQSQVVNRYEHDPHTAHLMWGGWADKSSQVRIARSKGVLRFNVMTTDNVHQPDTNNLTEGDCLILGLNIPGQAAEWKWAISHKDEDVLVQAISKPANAENYQPEVVLQKAKPQTFEIKIDEKKIGLVASHYESGLTFNLSTVDNDGDVKGVESFMHAAPVSEASEPDVSVWPRLIIEKK